LKCEVCNNDSEIQLDSHHLIPRYFDGQREDIIQVCRSCHRKIEIFTQNFLKWKSLDVIYWNDNEQHWLNDSCEWCNKTNVRVFSHHLIPRYVNGDGDIIELCMSCHRKFESYFWNFLVWGRFHAKEWQSPHKANLRNQKYYRTPNGKEKRSNYYLRNREIIKARSLNYFYKNREKCLARFKEWRLKKKEAMMICT